METSCADDLKLIFLAEPTLLGIALSVSLSPLAVPGIVQVLTVCASFLRFEASTAILLSAVVQ
jgi:hypothetical protein